VKRKILKNYEQDISELWDNIKWPNLHIIDISEERGDDENISKNITENSTNLMKNANPNLMFKKFKYPNTRNKK
jgi:hypothetical protein